MFSAREILDLAIGLEENGERYYRRASSLHQDSEVSTLLEGLAESEVEHRIYFTKMRDALEKSEPQAAWLQEISGALLKEMIGEKVFSLDEVNPRDLKTREAVLLAAIEFERDSIIFYEMLRSFVQDHEARKRLDQIIEEENRHVEILSHLLEEMKTQAAPST